MESIYKKINMFEEQRLCKIFGPVMKRNMELTYWHVLWNRSKVIWRRYGDIWMMHGYLLPAEYCFEKLFTEPRHGVLWIVMLPVSAILVLLAFFPGIIPASEAIKEIAGNASWIPGFISTDPMGFMFLILGMASAITAVAGLLHVASEIDMRRDAAQGLMKWIETWDNMIDSIINRMEDYDDNSSNSIAYHGGDIGCDGGMDTEGKI